jgi:hypothetical protein
MAKHTVKGYITYERSAYAGAKGAVSFQTWKPMPEYEPTKVIVAEHSIEVDVPHDFNPIPQQVAALREKKRQAQVKLADELRTIDEQISKLTCIEHTVEG